MQMMTQAICRIHRYCGTLFLFIFAGASVCLAAKPVVEAPPEPVLTLKAQCGVPFQDNAVLQQKIPLPVWGASLPGAEVTVRFGGQTQTATADQAGAWRVVLEPMDAIKLTSVSEAPEGMTMIIVCTKDGEQAVVEIKNVVLGDVWICAGQSNMAGTILTIIVKEQGPNGVVINSEGLVKENKLPYFPKDTVTSATFPALRQLLSGRDSPWLICSPQTVLEFTKVGFFFGRRLQRDALVPIGLIAAAKGGSRIETWLNQKPYARGKNYTRLIEPIVGYGVRGALWYQGESNENDKRGYQAKLESLITGWRKVWGQGPFPVHFVQLPGIHTSSLDNPAGGDGRAEIRQAFFETLAVTNTGMAVTIDIGAEREHPPYKYDTGVRLARSVLQKEYGFKALATSPLYTGHTIEGEAIRISFDNADNGLMVALKEGLSPAVPTPGATLQWLSIQASDGTWHWADGKIYGSDLVVSCKAVKEPAAVRYAYTQHPRGHLLYNKDGQPVGPFSTNGYGAEQ
ncbi:MAG: sialate O-acetylesterase [Candidatus Promineifilaceae bacterium]|jgi:sialate O-acetylesterase